MFVHVLSQVYRQNHYMKVANKLFENVAVQILGNDVNISELHS
jgi:hypothetical protein